VAAACSRPVAAILATARQYLAFLDPNGATADGFAGLRFPGRSPIIKAQADPQDAMTVQSQTAPVAAPLYSSGKKIAAHIFLETMAEIDLRQAMLRKVRREGESLVAGAQSVRMDRPPRVAAVGKAANRMAAALDEILGGQIERGIVVSPSPPPKRIGAFQYFEAGHPYPTAGSLAGAEAALRLVSGLSGEDLVIFLISGGGSAMLAKPLDPAVTLADLVEFNRVLVTGGMPIEEMNVLRKHLSAVKGGRLAVAAHPARQLTIFVSDVPDPLPSVVASGPTMPDESTLEECYAIAERRKLTGRFPPSIRRRFEEHTLEETPKPGDPRFENSSYFCLLSSHDAVETARAAAERSGFLCGLAPEPWDGDFREIADRNLAALEALAVEHPAQRVALVAGGEVTCAVSGAGMGGRNQAYVLYAARRIEGQKRVVLSAGTDGRDGNSPSAGAIADGQTFAHARGLGLDPARYLAESDSYYFFRTLGDTLDIGFTDNNVRDLRVWLDFGK
jgi:glycerate 2-kinase